MHTFDAAKMTSSVYAEMTPDQEPSQFGPWNPGIQSTLPRALLPLSTMFRPENVATSLEDANELSDFTGINARILVTFRPERLVVHELLIRVAADLSVSDGPKYEDLGINSREMTEAILSKHILPRMDEIVRCYDEVKREVSDFVAQELSSAGLFASASEDVPAPRKRGILGLFAPRRTVGNARPSGESLDDTTLRVLAEWRAKAGGAEDRLGAAAYRALIRTVTAIRNKHGRLVGDETLLTSLVVAMVCNEYGSEMIGQNIEPLFRHAAEAEGFRLLPSQDRRVVMNVKGASASGKSTMRPRQRELAEELGIRWADFALISPDIWRKFLLDYDSLGAARKYAGTLTGHEIKIIDQKLDRYMAKKAENGRMSHLLIDRFRFDSFAPDPGEREGGRLLTRFGRLVYMFFMITPPNATVERAWLRGEQVGRYKAVDDLLDHNVEAYTGMPRLFFTWAMREDKQVHYEFLDNSVAEGSRPRTVAFGWNGEMNILSTKCLLDVDRYRKIDIEATRPKDVYGDAKAMAPENNTEFLKQCARTLPVLNFADFATGRIYARLEGGHLAWTDPQGLAAALEDPDTKAGLAALVPEPFDGASADPPSPRRLDRTQAHTLGQWGPDGD